MASSAPLVQSAPLLQPYTDDPDVERDDPVQTTTDDDVNNRQNDALPPSPNLLLAAILHLLVVLDAPVVLALGFIFNERYRQIPNVNYIGWAAHIYFELFGVSVMTIIAAIWSFANLVSLRSRRPSSLLGPVFLGALVHAFLAFYLASTSLEELRYMIFRGNLESDCHYWDRDLQKGVYGPPECYAWVDKNTTLAWIYVAFLLVMSITQIVLFSAYLVWTWKTFVAWQLRRPTGTSRGGGAGRWVSSLSFPTGQMTVSFSVQFLGPRSFPAVTGNVTREGVQQPSGQQLPEQATQIGSGSA